MRTDGIGWYFPPTNGGEEDGYKHSGIASFEGARLESLARETIQNSLDARDCPGRPVEVDFEVGQFLRQQDVLGRAELSQALESCRERARSDEDAGAVTELERALELVEKPKLDYLRIADHRTTGLTDRNWKALVKMQGLSVKQTGSDALGSHGIGKFAPFAASPLRTVFYWTYFDSKSGSVERCQGKSVLMTHDGPDGPTQGTGFYGYRKGCGELEGAKIPACLRVLDKSGNPKPGTALYILGFTDRKGWQREVAGRVLFSFFHAVRTGRLEVTIEPDPDLEERGLLTIDGSTIGTWFDYLIAKAESSKQPRELDDLRTARTFWQLPERADHVLDRQDPDLGHCRLYLSIRENLPRKVALVRRSGMLITTEQAGLKRFRGLDDFAALCLFEAPKGNELLKDMENPAHDQFEPDRLPEGRKERGQRALNRITKWIRSSVAEHAKPLNVAATSAISELAELLPDPYAEDELGGGGGGGNEKSFSDRIEKLSLKPLRRRSSRGLAPEAGHDTPDSEGEGGEDGEQGGHGDGRQAAATESSWDLREGQGGGGGRGAVAGKLVPVRGVRILPTADRRELALGFICSESGIAHVQIDEAGDAFSIPNADLTVFDESGEQVDPQALHVKAGRRLRLRIRSAKPIDERAWRVTVVMRPPQSDEGVQP